jgi:hypothetical protein
MNGRLNKNDERGQNYIKEIYTKQRQISKHWEGGTGS